MCVCEFWLEAAASAADLTVTPERRIACSVSDEPNRSFLKERTQNRISAFFLPRVNIIMQINRPMNAQKLNCKRKSVSDLNDKNKEKENQMGVKLFLQKQNYADVNPFAPK